MRTTDRERVDNISRQIKTWYELTAATYGDDLNIKLQSTANEEDEANKDANSDIESDEENLDSIKIDESEFTDLEIDDKDTVLREIKEFRLLSIKFEKVKKDQEVEEKKERDKYLEKLTSNVLADGKATVRKHGEEEDRLLLKEISERCQIVRMIHWRLMRDWRNCDRHVSGRRKSVGLKKTKENGSLVKECVPLHWSVKSFAMKIWKREWSVTSKGYPTVCRVLGWW